MATCAISGTILDAQGAAVTSVTVSARVPSPVVSGTNVIVPFEVSAMTNASGNFVLTVQQSISVIFTVQFPTVGTEPLRTFNYTGNIPGTATATFTSVIVVE